MRSRWNTADFPQTLSVEPKCFERLVRDDRSVARKVLDMVKDFIRKVKWVISGHDRQNQTVRETFGMGLDTLEQVVRLWEDALRAGQETTLRAKIYALSDFLIIAFVIMVRHCIKNWGTCSKLTELQ